MSIPEEMLHHGAFLRRLARGLVGDGQRADDVVQEAYLAALQRPPTHGNLRAWLARVVRNRAARVHRTEARQSDRVRRAVEREIGGARRSEDPASAAERVETQQLVLAAVRELEEPYLTTIVMRYHDGLTPVEIARRTNTPRKTVETRLNRALNHLRARLDGAHGGDRRAWSIALLPLLRQPSSPAALIGGALMSKRLALVLVVLALAGTALFVNASSGRERATRAPTSSASRATVPPGADTSSGKGPDGNAGAASAPAGLRGHVVDDATGTAVKDADVAVLDYATGSIRRVRTDAEGRFTLPAHAGRVYRIILKSPRHAARTLRRVVAGAAPLTLRLETGAALSGTVVDPDGKPVPAASVTLVRPLGPARSLDAHADRFEQSVPEDLRYEARTEAAEGRFEFPRLSPGAALLLVKAPGFAPALQELGEPLIAGENREIVVPVPREAPVRIRVVDAQSGEPLRGVRIRTELTHGRQAYPIAAAEPRETEPGLYEVEFACRKDGRLGWTRISPDYAVATLQLRLERDGYMPHKLSFSGQPAGHTFREVMGRGGRITGTVAGPDAAVVLVSREMDGQLLARAPVDAEGRFSAGPLPGGDALDVHAYDASLQRVLGYSSVRLRHGETRTITFGAPDRPALLGVLRLHGVPVRRAILSLTGAGKRNVVFAGADGRFRFDELDSGRYELLANLSDDEAVHLTRYVEIAEEPVYLELDARYLIEGRVVSALTGAPITGDPHDVQARLVGGGAAAGMDATRLREDGTFSLCVTRPGTWELTVPRLFVDQRPRVVVPADGAPVQAEIAVREDPENRVLFVRVLDDASGKPVASGSFHFANEGPVRVTGGGGFQAGEATIDELPRGAFEVGFAASGYVANRIEVEFEGETRELRRTVRLVVANAVLITRVLDGGAAKPAGVRAGDVLLRYGSARVRNLAELGQALDAASATVAIELQRDGKPLSLSLPAGRLGVEAANHRIEE